LLIHICRTNYSIFKCNTSLCRSDHLLHFICLQRKRLTCLWGRFDRKYLTFQPFYTLVYVFRPTPTFTFSFSFSFGGQRRVAWIVQANAWQLPAPPFTLFKDTDYIGIFIVFVDSVLSLLKDSEFFRIFYCYYYFGAILIILILSPSLSIGTHLLRDYHSHTFETSLQHRPYLKDVHALLKICILITVKAL